MAIQRLFNFLAGTRISSSQVDSELDQLVAAINQHTTDIANGDTTTLNFTKQYGLGSVTNDITGQDLNSLDLTGFYYGSSLINGPTGFTTGYVVNIKKSINQRKQMFYDYNSGRTFTRTQYLGTWTPSSNQWIEFVTVGDPQKVNVGDSLWTGSSLPVASTSIVPSKKIDDCPNGWMIKWQNSPGTAYYSYSPIHKFNTRSSVLLLSCLHSTMIGGGAVNVPAKAVIVSVDGTTLSGHDSNNTGSAATRFMTEIFAF